MAASNSSVMPANGGGAGHSPLCRCRVLYIGSAVPTVTKDGLQGIQQPLRERYPTTESPETRGIDSWLSVWYNGLLLEYVEGEKRVESAFFPINTLHYCAAVRYVNMGGFSVEGGGERFIPLDSPFALPDSSAHPPIFAAIFRRTTGVKVLECHGFVCTNEKAANALVRCCFHAYADTMYLKLDEKLPAAGGLKALKEQSSRSVTPSSELNLSEQENGPALMENSAEWNERAIGQKTWQRRQQSGEYDASSISSSLVKKNGGGGRGPLMNGAGRQQHHQEQMLVPYGGPADNSFSRRAASHSELRSSGADFFESPRRPPGPGPMFFDPRFGLMPPPAGMPPPFFPGPPPPHFMRPPPHFFPPPPPPPHFPLHPAHFHRAAPPPNFGRISQFPPYMMRPFFMMPPPPPFLGPHRPKSPDRGSGPIITDVYDTFPRQNRATYEEPIYMPSSNNPRNSYKPGTEMYEHYYETYRQQRAPAEQKQQQHQQQNMSRSNSDASVDYWNNNNGFEPNAGRRAQNANERAFGHTLADEGGKKSAGNATPKANRSPLGTGKRNGHGVNNDKVGRADGQGTSRDAAPRPETPPADYEMGSEARGRRMAAY